MSDTTWATRPDLTETTIDTLLREVDGIKKLGPIYAASRVPYPVTGVDVMDAINYIIEKDVVGAFAKTVTEFGSHGVSGVRATVPIPIRDRSEFGRSTPNLTFEIWENPDNEQYSGILKNNYSGIFIVANFVAIPKP
jgi:putative transposon-encoded protein